MTKTNLLASAALLLVAACGDQQAAPPDAFHRIYLPDAASADAAPGIDATSGGIDAATSVTPDAAATTSDATIAPAATTVWVFGDFITNNFQQLGNFTDPVASPPIVPTTVPAVAAKLDSIEFSSPYSVSADGTAVAYATITTNGDQIDVSTNGGAAVDLFDAPTGVHVTDVAISPDGLHVAFRADINLSGMFDIFSVDTSVTPFAQVSPQRDVDNVALDASGFLTWSPDSRYLAYTGEFVAANRFELHVFDEMTSSDTTLLADADILAEGGLVGARAPAQFGADDDVFLLAVWDTAGDSQVLSGSVDGVSPLAVVASTRMERPGDLQTAQVSTFALSPNLQSIAFAADGVHAGAFEVYLAAVTDATATLATSGTHTAGQEVSSFQSPNWNHTSTAVAIHASYGATAGKFQPYIVDFGKAAVTRLATVGDDTDDSRNTQGNIAWTDDDATVYVIADAGATDNEFSVYALDVTQIDQTMTALVTVPTNGDILDVFTR